MTTIARTRRAAALLLVGCAVAAGCRRPAAPPKATELHVPKTRGEVRIDGEPDDATWTAPEGRTGAFTSEGGRLFVPHSEARFAWRDGKLYVFLYASDLDVEARVKDADGPVSRDEDHFHLELRGGGRVYAMDVSPAPALADGVCDQRGGNACGTPEAFDLQWQSGAEVRASVEETLNNPADKDEEWVIEMAIPLGSLGLKGDRGERLDVMIQRCDLTPTKDRVCGAYGAPLGSAALVLD